MMPMAAFGPGCGTGPPWSRALVTGGAGFLGSHLCTRLLDAGVQVDCLDNLSTGRAEKVAHLAGRPGFRFVERDIAEPGCADVLTGPYGLVLHLAGPAPPTAPSDRAVRILDAAGVGTRAALTVAGRDGARFLLASSPPVEPPAGGADPVGAHSAGAEAVRFSEALDAAHAGAHGANAGIVRLFAGYGPGMRTDGGGPPGDLGGEEEPTAVEIARRVIDLTGSDSPLAFVDGRAEPPGVPRPVTGFAREIFGWLPGVGWQDGLERTVAAFRGQTDSPAAVETGRTAQRRV